jgi:hypothetical protein
MEAWPALSHSTQPSTFLPSTFSNLTLEDKKAMVGKRKRQPPAEEDAEVLASIAGSDEAELAHGVETVVQLLAPWTTSLLVKLTVDNGEYLRIELKIASPRTNGE